MILFLPDVVGGVSSIVNNILANDKKHQISRIISYKNIRIPRHPIDPIIKSTLTHIRFEYDSRDNLYFTVNKLRKKLGRDDETIIATDSLELEMVHLSSIDVKVIFIVLGDFEHYYRLATMHESIIDGYIAISKEIYSNLCELLPGRKDSIYLSYFPTPDVEYHKKEIIPGKLNAVFVGRMEEGKNPLILIKIDDVLKRNGISILWTIVGDGPLLSEFKHYVTGKSNFIFLGMLSNHELHKIYYNQDAFILTSNSEGLPVSLIESMKSGLIPIVSDIKGGIREIVKNGENGYLCNPENENEFADAIMKLFYKPELTLRLSQNARNTVDIKFNAELNTQRYFEIIEKTPLKMKSKKHFHLTLNRLDKPWLPSFFVRLYRTYKTKIG